MTRSPDGQSVSTWKSNTPTPVGLGGSAFGWLVESDTTDAILDRFYDLGGRFIDTSDGYSYARRDTAEDSESLIGSWVRRRGLESEMRIITKVGLCPGAEGLSPPIVAAAAQASLDRLGVPIAEAILAHADDGVTPPLNIAEGLASLVGVRTRHVGVSRFAADRLAETRLALAHQHGIDIAVVQEEFSLAERGGLEAVTTGGTGMPAPGLLCSAGLARGFLTGKFQYASDRVGARQAFAARHYASPAHDDLLDGLRTLATQYDVSPAAIAIRWLIQHQSVALPLVSVTTPEQLTAFSEAGSIDLSTDEWTALDCVSRRVHRPSGVE